MRPRKEDQVAGCCNPAKDYTEDPTEPMSLLDQVRAEKARISLSYRRRMKELENTEKLLMNSDAERIIQEANSTLNQSIKEY